MTIAQPIQVNRGVSVFNALLFDEPVNNQSSDKREQGRSAELIDQRDRFLIYRFYFKAKIQRKIYNDAIVELIPEVYLSKVQIQKIIQTHADDILRLKKNPPTIKDLQKDFPHINW